MKRHLRYGSDIIEYQVVRSNRRKTSELFVDSRTVLIRTPSRKSTRDIERIIKAKAHWIVKKQEQYKRHLWQASSPTFDQNSLLPYLGKGYALHVVIDRYKEKKIRFVNDEFLATLKSSKNQRQEVRKLFYAWLEQKAKSILRVKVRKYSRFVSAKPRKIIIKDMKNRWGSATNSDVLNFNVKLLKAPEDVIDYIVLHELCHLKVRDHSHHFWNLLRKIMPDYLHKVDWLSTNAQGLVE